MSDLQPSDTREFRLWTTLRTLITDPPAAMATIAAARPWGRGFALAVLLLLLNGLVDLLAPLNRQLLDDPNLPDLFRPLLSVLTSPWWAIINAFLIFPAVALVSVCICLACGRLLAGEGTFAGLLATQMFALVPLVFLIPVTLILNLLRVPVVGGVLALLVVVWMAVLSLIGIRASLSLAVGRAIVTLFSPLLAGALLAVCLVLAPLVGDYLESRAATRRAGVAQAEAPMIQKIDLATNDLVYDRYSDTIYASVPGSVPTVGNSIVPINPQTGVIGTPIPVGNEPGTLALSDDGHYLYVALDKSGAFQRVDLRTRQADLQFPLGLDLYDGQRFAETIAVLPGQPETIAVARTTHGPVAGHRGVAIYRDGRQLPLTTADHVGSNSIAFCDSAAILYGYNNDGEFGLRTMAVNDSGVRELSVTEGIFSGYDATIHCANNRLYATTGQVADAATFAPLGTFEGDTIRSLSPDTNGQVLSLGETTGEGTHSYRLNIGDGQDFHLRWSLDLFGVPVEEPYVSIDKGLVPAPSALRRWGDDGIVFRASTSEVWIVRAPQIAGRYETPAASSAPRAAANMMEVQQLDLAVNDLQYDARGGLIYASVSGIDPHYGNSIVAIDPLSGVISRVSAVESEPSILALSDDRRYLYVALNDARAIARIDLATKRVDLTIPTSDARGDTYTVRAIVVLPGDSRTIVVGKAFHGDFLTAETVVAYTDGRKRARMAIGNIIGANGLFFCDDSAILYGAGGGRDSYSYSVTTDGVLQRDMAPETFPSIGSVLCAGGLFYDSAGVVFDPVSQQRVGFFAQTDADRTPCCALMRTWDRPILPRCRRL
jgi:DNA-binding beta-propeller fold protein YncE